MAAVVFTMELLKGKFKITVYVQAQLIFIAWKIF
jgi:hypothetical protein